MRSIQSVLQNLGCVSLAIFLSYYSSGAIGELYCEIIHGCSAGIASVNFSGITGILLGAFFFVPFFLASFGSKEKYWWIAMIIFPGIIWALYAGARVSQLAPLLFSSIFGALLGIVAHLILIKHTPKPLVKISN